MKLYRPLLIISLFVLYLTDIIGQNTDSSYKLSKIILSTGEIVKAKNISLTENNVSFIKYNSTSSQKEIISYNLSDVKNINVATKNNVLPGFLIGTGVGAISMIIVKKIVEKPKNETTSGPGYTQTSTTVTKMSPGPELLIVAGGSLLGTIIGVSIKRGWETVFPKSTSMNDNIDFNLALDYNNGYKPGLKIIFKF
jgi:hypothetical protein